MFDFGIVNTADDNNCDQQARASHSVYKLTTPAGRWRWCLVYNSCGLTPSRTGSRIKTCTWYFAFETRISPQRSVWGVGRIWMRQ